MTSPSLTRELTVPGSGRYKPTHRGLDACGYVNPEGRGEATEA
jgi:hypothetical protein